MPPRRSDGWRRSTIRLAAGWTAIDRSVASPEPDLVARFASDCRALIGGNTPRFGVAVSGGPDSLALLILAAAAFPRKVIAATVDHGLREESAEEARLVARYCRELRLPHRILAIGVEPGNVSDRAREARYAALAGWANEESLSHVATGHHADDQAETLLMRLNRASGAGGLAGIRARATIAGLKVVRPLLGWRRAELAAIVAANEWKAVDDPTNRDPRFDRARLRRELADSDWLDPVALAQSAAHLADAEEGLEWASDTAFQSHVSQDGDRLALNPDLPREIALRIIMRIIVRIAGSTPRGSEVARLYETLKNAEVATLAGVVARPGKQVWRFGKAPPRR